MQKPKLLPLCSSQDFSDNIITLLDLHLRLHAGSLKQVCRPFPISHRILVQFILKAAEGATPYKSECCNTFRKTKWIHLVDPLMNTNFSARLQHLNWQDSCNIIWCHAVSDNNAAFTCSLDVPLFRSWEVVLWLACVHLHHVGMMEQHGRREEVVFASYRVRAFKHHADSWFLFTICFQYTMTIHYMTLVCVSHHQPTVYFHLPSALRNVNSGVRVPTLLAFLTFQLEKTFTWIFPVIENNL